MNWMLACCVELDAFSGKWQIKQLCFISLLFLNNNAIGYIDGAAFLAFYFSHLLAGKYLYNVRVIKSACPENFNIWVVVCVNAYWFT